MEGTDAKRRVHRSHGKACHLFMCMPCKDALDEISTCTESVRQSHLAVTSVLWQQASTGGQWAYGRMYSEEGHAFLCFELA